MVFRRVKLKSVVVKRNVAIGGHKTSISVEDAFWKGLKEIAADRNMTLTDLVTTINSKRERNNLSSAVRLFVLDHYDERRKRLVVQERS
jgi:predicted DNA-binding ribbon-helix-helix protein